MRPLSPFFITALLALTWTTFASAENSTTDSSLAPGVFAAVTEIQLDDVFEKMTAQGSDDFLQRLAGPTSMDCTNAVARNEFETCVVTAVGTPQTSVPAALAQH